MRLRYSPRQASEGLRSTQLGAVVRPVRPRVSIAHENTCLAKQRPTWSSASGRRHGRGTPRRACGRSAPARSGPLKRPSAPRGGARARVRAVSEDGIRPGNRAAPLSANSSVLARCAFEDSIELVNGTLESQSTIRVARLIWVVADSQLV